jgi:hypothetical protein
MSCVHLNTALEKAGREFAIEMKGTIYHKTFQILANTVLVGRIIGMLKEAIKDLNNTLKKMGLTINIQKTNVSTEPKTNKYRNI